MRIDRGILIRSFAPLGLDLLCDNPRLAPWPAFLGRAAANVKEFPMGEPSRPEKSDFETADSLRHRDQFFFGQKL
jgi:hypothetical protein